MTDKIRLPPSLRPTDGRFGSGPSKVRPEAVFDLAATGPDYLGTSHRRDGVRGVVRAVRTGLTELLSLPDGYEVVVGVGGATAFWDAATFGLVAERSQHAVCGEFSSKFAAAAEAAPHLKSPDVVEAEPGTAAHPVANPDVDTYALVHNETSTGVMCPVVRPSGDGVVVVDATSGAGALPIEPRDFDVYYFSPQKVFAADAGIWVAAFSPAAIARVESLANRWTPAFLSLSTAVAESRKDQTYNTPPLAALFLLAHSIDWLLEQGGLPWAVARTEGSSGILYRWADSSPYATPFVKNPAERSPVVGTIDFDESVDAAAVAATLRANRIVDVEPYRKLGRNQLRIAMFPAIEPADVERLTKAIDFIVERLA